MNIFQSFMSLIYNKISCDTKKQNRRKMSNLKNCAGCDEESGSIQIQSSAFISKMFFEVTSIKVNSDHSLCKLCQKELKQCYSFRQRVIEIHSLYEGTKSLSDEPNTDRIDDKVEQVFLNEIETVKLESDVNLNDELVGDSNWEEDRMDSHNEESLHEWKDIAVDNAKESQEDFKSLLEDNESETHEDSESVHKEWSPNSRFKCPSCPKTFQKQSALSTHQLSHSNLRNFNCPRSGCTSAFNVLYRLLRHMRNVHTVDETEIEAVKETSRKRLCEEKSQVKEVKSKSANEQTRVQCEICMKVLSNVKYLKEHMSLQHLDNAPYVCDKKGCGKKFTDWSLMEKHQKKHDGNFEFKCDYCSKGFVQRKTLNQHLRTSHQISKDEVERMQKNSRMCSECGLVFKTQQKLSEHKSFSHGMGSKFVCDYCGKLFYSRIVLVSHQKYHQEGGKKLKCTKCPSSFTEEKGLKTHMRRVHKLSDIELYDIFMKN